MNLFADKSSAIILRIDSSLIKYCILKKEAFNDDFIECDVLLQNKAPNSM